MAIHSAKLVTHYISIFAPQRFFCGRNRLAAGREKVLGARRVCGKDPVCVCVCVFCARCSSSGETQDANQAEIETSMSRSFFLNKVRHAPALCMVFYERVMRCFSVPRIRWRKFRLRKMRSHVNFITDLQRTFYRKGVLLKFKKMLQDWERVKFFCDRGKTKLRMTSLDEIHC